MSKLLVMVVGLALIAAACGTPTPGGDGAADAGVGGATTTTTIPVTQPTGPDGLPVGPSALRDRLAPEFPDALIDVSQIFSGGPPPDGIPPIDDPRFVGTEVADAWIGDLESVVVVAVDGDARAYPTQILIWHEIVNDVVAGVPVAVTYCPLCNSAVAWERTIDGVVTTFGTSGSLFNSALVMYDRATESLWTHYDGRAVVGLLAGRALQVVPAPLMAYGDFKAAHPDGVVLDRDATGFARDYGRNPYVGYDSPDGTPFLFRGSVDERAVAMQRVAGVTIGEVSVAWSLEAISGGEARATAGRVGDTPVVILWKSGQRSALDTADTEVGRDVGSVGVFVSRIDDRSLTFDAVGPDFVDRETGSTWNIAGVAVAGELAGSALERVAHLDTFWFAWSTYRPGTTLHTE